MILLSRITKKNVNDFKTIINDIYCPWFHVTRCELGSIFNLVISSLKNIFLGKQMGLILDVVPDT